MPPEEPGNLTVLDLRFGENGRDLQATIERVDAPLKDWLSVSWAARTTPEGYAELGGGVVRYRQNEQLQKTGGEGEVDLIGNLAFGWRQKTNAQGLMLVLVLPPGYTLGGHSVQAEAAKPFDGERIAVYWMLTSTDGRVSLEWSLARRARDAREEAAQLNRQFYAGGRGPSPGYVFVESDQPIPVSPGARRIRVFCSYSRPDEDYLLHLLKYLEGMKDEGFEFWQDRMIRPGDDWHQSIKDELGRADIALMLISQTFLNSEYIKNIEIRDCLARRSGGSLRLLPVLLSPCDWKSQPWLASIQMVPRDDKTIETHYKEGGERKALFLTILQELRAAGDSLREAGGKV